MERGENGDFQAVFTRTNVGQYDKLPSPQIRNGFRSDDREQNDLKTVNSHHKSVHCGA